MSFLGPATVPSRSRSSKHLSELGIVGLTVLPMRHSFEHVGKAEQGQRINGDSKATRGVKDSDPLVVSLDNVGDLRAD